MKTSPAMPGTGKLFGALFLISHLGLCSIHGEVLCSVQLLIRRHSVQFASSGAPFKIRCPVKYCDENRPHVTWCKVNGTACLPLEKSPRLHTSWEGESNSSVFLLHFEPVFPHDNGSYSCNVNLSSQLIKSHSTIIYVTEQTQNNSEHPLIILTDVADATRASGPFSKEEMADRPWLLHILLPVGGSLLLIIAFFCLFYCLKSHQGKQKQHSDIEERETNLVDVSQLSRSEQMEMSIRQNSHLLPSEPVIYDNDPMLRGQEGSEVYSYPCLEESKQGIVYASLNHSIIGMNPRLARNLKEAPTEYASICVRS